LPRVGKDLPRNCITIRGISLHVSEIAFASSARPRHKLTILPCWFDRSVSWWDMEWSFLWVSLGLRILLELQHHWLRVVAPFECFCDIPGRILRNLCGAWRHDALASPCFNSNMWKFRLVPDCRYISKH
jgi:hypothetical protein